MKKLFSIGLLASGLVFHTAQATVYDFVQSSASPTDTGLVTGSITVNGTLADLPNISSITNKTPYNQNYVYNFGNLLAFNLTLPVNVSTSYDLQNFAYVPTPMQYYNDDYATWSISDSGIIWSGLDTSFQISFLPNDSTIKFITDAPAYNQDCQTSALGCTVTGKWVDPPSSVPVPEPGSLLLLGSGLFLLGVVLKKR